MPNCSHCNKPLRAVGVRRANGKAGKPDWPGRTLHTKCWRERTLKKFGDTPYTHVLCAIFAPSAAALEAGRIRWEADQAEYAAKRAESERRNRLTREARDAEDNAKYAAEAEAEAGRRAEAELEAQAFFDTL